MKKFVSNNPEESRKFAGDLAKEILAGNPMSRRNFDIDTGALVLALYGDLGSGKTTFAQAFAEALGVKEKIKSPTFIIFRKSKIPASSAGGLPYIIDLPFDNSGNPPSTLISGVDYSTLPAERD